RSVPSPRRPDPTGASTQECTKRRRRRLGPPGECLSEISVQSGFVGVENYGEKAAPMADPVEQSVGRWPGRPVQAAVLRVAAVAIPVAAGVGSAVLVSHVVGYPHTGWAT